MKKVITLQNGSCLNAKQFIHYFERKVFYALRKYKLLQSKKLEIRELFKLKKINDATISHECLDDIAYKALEAFTKKNAKKELKKLLPLSFEKNKKVVRPFYFVSRKELELYKKLKKIKVRTRKERKRKIELWLDSMEKKHPEIKNAIVNFLIKLSSLI
ncbi:MAG: hypothetical protein QXE93_01055 [Candidatus Pacearchaeota archaeon]